MAEVLSFSNTSLNKCEHPPKENTAGVSYTNGITTNDGMEFIKTRNEIGIYFS